MVRAASQLLRSIRAQDGLRAGSLLVTIFGDAIAPRGRVVALSSLIAAGRLFGITERHVRTAVGRLAHDGWIDPQRIGRLSFYRLSNSGARRFAEATGRIYGPPARAWDGRWTLLALPPVTAAIRERTREELSLLGFGQLRNGLFVHPAPFNAEVEALLKRLGLGEQIVAMRAEAVAGLPDSEIAQQAWDLAQLEARYRRFIRMFAPLVEAIGADRDLGGDAAFVVRILLIHEYRRIHLRDPMLPSSLLPANWVGREAHQLCRLLYARTFRPAERFMSATLRNAHGPLPAAEPAIYQRFGGLAAR